jgi:hypothetical protein
VLFGEHQAFRQFIDWYYTALALRVGGKVLVDDMHIQTCDLLRHFLSTGPAVDQSDAPAIMRQ